MGSMALQNQSPVKRMRGTESHELGSGCAKLDEIDQGIN